MGAIPPALALFQSGAKQFGVDECDFVTYRPVGQISDSSPIEFQIHGTSSEYVLLSKTRLHMRVKVSRTDGEDFKADDEVAYTNLSLHSLFRQVDVSLNQQVMTSNVGVNYPYKAMLDVLLGYGHDSRESMVQSEG